MNIITASDVKKFLTLVQAGMQKGRSKELRVWTSATNYDGTDVAKEYYVSLDFKFRVDRDVIDELFVEEDFDVAREVNDLMKGL